MTTEQTQQNTPVVVSHTVLAAASQVRQQSSNPSYFAGIDGIRVAADGKRMTVTATNGHVLLVIDMPGIAALPAPVTIPPGAIKSALRDDLGVYVYPDHISIPLLPDVDVSVRPLDGAWPDVEGVIAKAQEGKPVFEIAFDPHQLAMLCQALALAVPGRPAVFEFRAADKPVVARISGNANVFAAIMPVERP